MKRMLGALVGCLLAGTASAQGSAWPGRIEILPVPSATVSLERMLTGKPSGPEVMLGGELRLPFGATGKVSAVILIHSSGGIGAVPAACRHLVTRWNAVGADIAMTEYADSRHGFDRPTSLTLFAVPQAQSTRNCRLKDGPGGALLDAETGQPYSLKTDPCVAIGEHVVHHPAATEPVRADVMAFLTKTLLK